MEMVATILIRIRDEYGCSELMHTDVQYAYHLALSDGLPDFSQAPPPTTML